MAGALTRPLRFLGGSVLALGLLVAPVNRAQAAVFYPQSFTLGNGMQVIVVQNRLSPAVAQMVWYKAGAVDDPDGHSGLAHYLEHMMFKGTPTIPAGAFSAIVARMGGDENAFTTHDATAYHEVVSSDRLGEVMAMEADRMRHLRIDPAEAVPELAVVMSERQQRTDNSPQGIFNEKMAAALFPDHPYGRPVIGWASEIAQITPAQATAFYNAHYAPNNAVLVVSGNVRVDDVLRLASGTFGRLPVQKITLPRRVSAQVRIPQHKRVEMQDARVKQPFVVERFVVPSQREDRMQAYAMEVLAEALSADEVGLLYRHFVMDRKIATGIDASYDGIARGPGLFALGATPAPGQDVRSLEKEVTAYFRKLARTGLSAKAVAQAKQRLEDLAVFARDRLMAPAEILGGAVVRGVPVAEIEAWPSRIRAVTPAQVNQVLRALVHNPHHVTGILEPAAEGQEP